MSPAARLLFIEPCHDRHMSADPCPSVDVTGGHCQLVMGHKGPHAAELSGAFVTWRLGVVHRWRKNPPPPWIVALPWLPKSAATGEPA
jgi:hypothetical protein